MKKPVEVQNGISFCDKDVVNIEDWIPIGESNPHRVRPWLLHDHGFTLAVVFADCLQDAIDEAFDTGKLDCFKVEDCDLGDYPNEDEDGRLSYLGNFCVACDVEGLGILELQNPQLSFAALYKAAIDEAGV